MTDPKTKHSKKKPPIAKVDYAEVIKRDNDEIEVIIKTTRPLKYTYHFGDLQNSIYRIKIGRVVYHVNKDLYYTLVPYSNLCKGKKIKSLIIIGLLCHTTVGTEFTSTIFINGYKVATVGPGSNSNDFYKQAAIEWLNNYKYFNGIPVNPVMLSQDFRELGLPFYCSSVLVKTLKECYSGV